MCNINLKQNKKAILFPGRFQPFTLAHEYLAKDALSICDNLIIGIIKGEKSSSDKEKNPFDYNFQREIIHNIIPEARIFEFKNGFIPDIILAIRKYGYEVWAVTCGNDRSKDYERQLKYFETLSKENSNFQSPHCELLDFHRSLNKISATEVRESIKNNDFKTFKKMTSLYLHPKFKILQNFINK